MSLLDSSDSFRSERALAARSWYERVLKSLLFEGAGTSAWL